MNPYGMKVKYLAASGLVESYPISMMAILSMHGTGSVGGTIYFYNTTAAPTIDDVPVGQINIEDKGTIEFQVPDGGILFDKGAYLVFPANSTIDVFYKDARFA
jgi:hypothetical protein